MVEEQYTEILSDIVQTIGNIAERVKKLEQDVAELLKRTERMT
jgi:hypothetical protein